MVSHGNSFLQVQNLVYSTFYIKPNSKILPIKSFTSICKLEVSLLFRERKKLKFTTTKKRGRKKKGGMEIVVKD